MTYRTFKNDKNNNEWRWDGMSMEIRITGAGWSMSICNLDDLIEASFITETTPKS